MSRQRGTQPLLRCRLYCSNRGMCRTQKKEHRIHGTAAQPAQLQHTHPKLTMLSAVSCRARTCPWTDASHVQLWPRFGVGLSVGHSGGRLPLLRTFSNRFTEHCQKTLFSTSAKVFEWVSRMMLATECLAWHIVNVERPTSLPRHVGFLDIYLMVIELPGTGGP